MKTVLITGCTGFIGRNLFERFLGDKEFLILALVAQNDKCGQLLLDQYHIRWITSNDFDKYNETIDYCIHLASYGVAYGDRNLDAMIDINIGLAEKVMRYAKERNCKLFINTGSCFEYGTKISNRPLKEDDSLNPEDIYAATKVACEDVLNVYSHLLDVKMITIRPFSIYGKYENSNRIMPLIFNSGFTRTPLSLTAGEQVRDYMNVKDVANSIYLLIKNEQKLKNHDIINICSGQPISLKNFIMKIVNACSFDQALFHFGEKEYRKNESMFFVGSNDKLVSYIGGFDFSIKDEDIKLIFNQYCNQWK